ncbi:hypothetical protein APHAL10511_005762 [Amanita phalloides]|nr:hypothetical protein APHAL10511_005762 [Amanita phalloides]
MVPRTESSELVMIPELDEDSSNNLERPELTILTDGILLPLSISYKQVVNFLKWCNDDNMEEVGAGERKGMERHGHDMMDIDSDSDADNCESDCDDSESDGMSMNAWKVPQRGHPKKAIQASGSK